MRILMDSFHQAVEDARRELIKAEGKNVSNAEVIRRAGLTAQHKNVMRHLNPNQAWPKGHRVPPEIVQRLAVALRIPEHDLMKAAQTAAGYRTAEELPAINPADYVARYLGDSTVSDEERAETLGRLAELLAEELRRTN